MELLCEYCKAKYEGVEYKAKNRVNKGFNELLKENNGSFAKARRTALNNDKMNTECTCKELVLKLQCSSSLQCSYTKSEVDSMLQESLRVLANVNNDSGLSSASKQTIVSLLKKSLSENNLIHCRKRLTKVQELDLCSCQLKELPESFGLMFVEIRRLDLSYNDLSDLPTSLTECVHLDSINLSKNRFTYLPYCLTKLPNLQCVHTSYNLLNQVRTLFQILETTATHGDSPIQSYSPSNTAKNDWVEKQDPYRDRIVYFNKRTGEVSVNREKEIAKLCAVRKVDTSRLKQLGALFMDNNQLHSFPYEITLMRNLTVLRLQNNQLSSLPEELNDLVGLKVLNVSQNKLRSLPNLHKCIHMEELDIASNIINQFPACIIKMKKLKSLKINSNQIQTVPFEIGFLSELSCLISYDNPITEPPCDVFNQNINQVLWECRQLHWNRQKGDAPSLEIHKSGIANERCALIQDFNDLVLKKVHEANSNETKQLELQYSNLTSIPNAIYNNWNIQRIDFRNNPVQTLDWKHESPRILSLNLSGCMLNSVTEAISNLSGLESLNLEYNFLTHIPQSMSKLNRLKELLLGNNQLGEIPKDLGHMVNLNVIRLCHNRLQNLPDSIGDLPDLRVIAASHNLLKSIPFSILQNKQLKSLNFRQNKIMDIPPLGTLSLDTLLLSNNCIEKLDPYVFTPDLMVSINHLELNGNKLRELPHSFPRCLKSNIDMNPLISPPLTLANEGINSIVNYCILRHQNITKFCEGLKKSEFITSYDRFHPPARNVISNTSYFIPDDLIRFDELIDSCVNGPFYCKDFSVKQIIQDISDLRHQRIKETQKKILDQVLLQLNSFRGKIFRRDITKRFGLFSKKVPCFAIPLEQVLLNDANPSSIFQKVKDSLQYLDSLFSFDDMKLKDSFKFQSPFGPVASIENVIYELDESKKSFMSLVIAQHIYSEEEAARKEEEEIILHTYFQKMEVRIENWATTRHGIRSINAEVSQRIKTITKTLRETKKKLSQFRTESADKEKIMEKRLKDYNEKQPYDFHFIANEEAAKRLRDALQNTKRENTENLLVLEKKFVDAKAAKEEYNKRSMNMRHQAISDMKTKCCNQIHQMINMNGRAYALLHNLLRPWDDNFASDVQKERCHLKPKAMRDKLDSLIESIDFVWTNTVNIDENEVYRRYKDHQLLRK